MPGRKKLYDKKKIQICAQLEPEVKQRLASLSGKLDKTVSSLVNEAVIDLIVKYQDYGVYGSADSVKERTRVKMLEQDGKNHNTVAIVVANHKGGVAKTTTVSSLAVIAGQDNKKVLIIDLDKQMNLSDLFGYSNSDNLKNIGDYLYSCIKKIKKNSIDFDEISQYISPTEYKNVDIILGSEDLDDDFSTAMSQANSALRGKSITTLMIDAIKALNIYDYIIFDSNPNLNTYVLDAISSADYTVTTTDVDKYGIDGVVKINDYIAMNESLGNNISKHLGALFTRVDSRTALAKAIPEFKNNLVAVNIPVFDVVIPISAAVGKTRFNSIPVVTKYPTDKVTKKYKEVYRELVNKIGQE